MSPSSPRSFALRSKTCALVCLLAVAAAALSGCVTVRPEQRAILADPTMQLRDDAREEQALNHVLENREGSIGGGTVQGGGCGCN